MHIGEVGEISKYLSGRVGETKGLQDWCREINGEGVTRRKLTGRELSFIIHRHLKNGPFQVEHRTCPVQYTFFKGV